MDDTALKVLLETAKRQVGQVPESLRDFSHQLEALVRRCYDLEKKYQYGERDIVQDQIRRLVEDFITRDSERNT